jgi:hypothetical protein
LSFQAFVFCPVVMQPAEDVPFHVLVRDDTPGAGIGHAGLDALDDVDPVQQIVERRGIRQLFQCGDDLLFGKRPVKTCFAATCC